MRYLRDAIYAETAWKRLSFTDAGRAGGVNVYAVDLRGYKGITEQAVLAGQFYYSGADKTLPDYERPFLGGAATLRGHEPGAFFLIMGFGIKVDVAYNMNDAFRVHFSTGFRF